MVRQLGPWIMLAKIDLHHAYRMLPVHADDHPLLGINWGGNAPASMPQLDLSQLEENVSFFLGQALAPSTLRSYRSGQKRFLRFCQEAILQPLPLTEHVLCLFVAQLGRERLSHQTIKCYLCQQSGFFTSRQVMGTHLVLGHFPGFSTASAKAAGSASSPHYTTDSTRPKVTVVAIGCRPGLCHAMGSMLCRFFGGF